MTAQGDLLLRARRLLEQDRVWCAYALADLEAPFAEQTSWLVGEAALAMVFHGLTPPLLFVHGDPSEADALVRSLPAGEYQYALLGTHRSRIGRRLHSVRQARMWRMVLREPAVAPEPPAPAERLGQPDLPALAALFADHPDRPDSFDPGQLAGGLFFGVRVAGQLVAVAGTHVVGREAKVAAVGNVFTHPRYRRQGLAFRASSAVVHALLARGMATIVLNVAIDNGPALDLYHALGFWPFCGYYEGAGEISAA